MDIHIVAASPPPDAMTGLTSALQQRWPHARVVTRSSGIARRPDPHPPPHLAVILHHHASVDTTSDIEALRRMTDAPIVVMSPAIPESTEIAWLHLGADLVLEPTSVARLVAILEALVRRANGDETLSKNVHTVGDLTLDTYQGEISIAGERVSVTPTEFRILEILAVHAGACVPSPDLTCHVWGTDNDAVRKSLKVHMSRLRHRLEAAGSELTVRGVRGSGYALEPRHVDGEAECDTHQGPSPC